MAILPIRFLFGVCVPARHHVISAAQIIEDLRLSHQISELLRRLRPDFSWR
ncbi:hypothetical protein [Povalibacter sp.]|uniref:hypothetical protein n=1 Tax=Povalibacter sp. TaxID=1962978 RepID=UPI002D1FB1AD|nr:hypothetical protein [Povalibacter sp.]